MSDDNNAMQEAFASGDEERLLALLDAVRVRISSQGWCLDHHLRCSGVVASIAEKSCSKAHRSCVTRRALRILSLAVGKHGMISVSLPRPPPPPPLAHEVFGGVQPETLFACLDSQNERVLETACNLLDRFLGRLTPEAILTDHQVRTLHERN